ncbi:MAG: hypothetical protein KatS3mg061_1872 [Dehalococcoidia bacterium]|nr:MAG: hypothetical protein KatS3mg061_1872 [Dehalococcoidia bacterium]
MHTALLSGGLDVPFTVTVPVPGPGEVHETILWLAYVMHLHAAIVGAPLRERARAILDAPDPLACVREEIARLGYGGDPMPAPVTYLCLTTRLLAMRRGAMPGHLLLLGPPSADKSYTLAVVLLLLPPEAVHIIDAGSPRVLIYDDADLWHRVVFLSEADSLPASEDNPAASALRDLLQGHTLHYKVTVRDPDTGAFTVHEIEKPGPTLLVTTAVKSLGPQRFAEIVANIFRLTDDEFWLLGQEIAAAPPDDPNLPLDAAAYAAARRIRRGQEARP